MMFQAQESFSAGNWTEPSYQKAGSHSLVATITAYALATLLLYVVWEQISFWSMRYVQLVLFKLCWWYLLVRLCPP